MSNAVRHRLVTLEPWLILALTPCFLFPGAWTLWAVLALPVLWLGRWAMTGRRVARPNAANWPLLLLCLTVFPALRAASDLAAARQTLLYLLLGVALCWSLMQRRPGHVESVLWTAALLGMALLLGLLLPLTMLRLPTVLASLTGLTASLPPIMQETVSPNVLAGGPALLAPLALAVLVGRLTTGSKVAQAESAAGVGTTLVSVGLRLLALLALLVSLAAMVVTYSRGALLAVLGGAVLLALLDWSTSRRWWLPALLPIAVGLGLFVGPFVERALPPLKPDETVSLDGRLPIWGAAVRMVGRAPLVGIGLGNFRLVMARDEPIVLPLSPKGANHAHNLCLQVAADLGLIGLAAFLTLYALSLRAAYRAWRSGGGALAMGLLGGLTAAALHGLVDAVQWGTKPAFLLWLFMGLALSLENE